jgi:archaemetzincin
VKEIAIWWIGASGVSGDLLDAIQRRVAGEFGVPAGAHLSVDRPEGTLDPRRGQHSSTKILLWLAERRPESADRVLAITDADLFIPILTFVFGEAQLRGRTAVVSTARLAGDGLVIPDPARFRARVITECVHELGHTFGLLHCQSPRCAMARSPGLREVDAKSENLCPACRERYLELASENGENDEQEKHPHPGRR